MSDEGRGTRDEGRRRRAVAALWRAAKAEGTFDAVYNAPALRIHPHNSCFIIHNSEPGSQPGAPHKNERPAPEGRRPLRRGILFFYSEVRGRRSGDRRQRSDGGWQMAKAEGRRQS
jgi:hypothetical protein